jgi:hypothetical protein
MDFVELIGRHRDELEDFWNRRVAEPRHTRNFRVFGRAVRLTSNDEPALRAVDYSLPMYSRLPATDHAPFEIHLVVQPARVAPGPAPDDLMDFNWYSGHGRWQMIQLAGWGSAFVDLADGRAVAVLAPELAERPELVSRCLLNTILLNFCLANGFGMLHASCLYRQGRALLLLAPHHTGKSTTALRLALEGYPLVTDSMVQVSPHCQELWLAGFPVGVVKLRADMIKQFPQLQRHLETERVRDETKYRVDLRRLDNSLVREEAVAARAVELCLLSRHPGQRTRLLPASEEEVWQAVMGSSLYFDSEETWQQNLAQLRRCIDGAGWHHLLIGSDSTHLLAVVEQLWEE